MRPVRAPAPSKRLLRAVGRPGGLGVVDMSGASNVAAVSLVPFNTLGAVTYTHEWTTH